MGGPAVDVENPWLAAQLTDKTTDILPPGPQNGADATPEPRKSPLAQSFVDQWGNPYGKFCFHGQFFQRAMLG
ncbi:MAG: hypothetical protein BWX54_01405 [Verrucomicrobia bacterium ADurb.Bin018]|nr:MAG: hypothetical protein BWX54_01405 [Verrucomicrobia bacterium ADurb.Bin018]